MNRIQPAGMSYARALEIAVMVRYSSRAPSWDHTAKPRLAAEDATATVVAATSTGSARVNSGRPSGSRPTLEQIELMESMIARNLPVLEVAAAVGVSSRTVTRHRKALTRGSN